MAISHPVSIDGYDWEISDEPPTYRRQDRQDACERALAWRQSQLPHFQDGGWDWDLVAPKETGDPGWLHIGHVIEWDKQRLRILWHPEAEAVRVEQPKSRSMTIEVEAPEPLPLKPIQFTFTLKRSPECPTVSVRLRFYSGPEDLTFPVISMQVPPPPEASRLQWEWTTRLAESRMNVIELPNTFLETPGSERMPMFREAIYARLQQIQDDGGRRH